MKTYIHVNQHIKNENKKTGENKPVFTVKRGEQNLYGHRVDILKNSSLVYSPDKPLSCGAMMYLLVDSNNITIHNVDGQQVISVE